jgi:hypothetical protein
MLGLLICFNALAAPEQEPSWKTNLRTLVTSIAGERWGEKLFGEPPVPAALEIPMPTIPQMAKKSTDISSYTKQSKGPTEYDGLPPQKKRQFDYAYIKELYQVTRKSDPKDEDLASWLNTLDQGGSREGIYQGLVLDEVYSALEEIEERPSKRLLEFCKKFSQKYFNQTMKDESLVQLNLYSLKRILTEKGIDLMEFFETKDLEELYRWYAHFSADTALDAGAILASPLREQKDVNFHYQWAKKMPIQHIKSEFIVKLHKVMNGFQQSQE